MTKYSVVLITASSQQEAEKLANLLIDRKAAACVNIVPKVSSVFMWQGKKEICDECLLIAKTKTTKFDEIKKLIKDNHSYEVPEIIAIPISKGNEDYLGWISEVVG